MTKVLQNKIRAKFSENESFPYSDAFMCHAMTPENVGSMEAPDGYGGLADASGQTIEIHLRIVNGRNEECAFMASGSLHTVACGSAVTSLATGRSLRSAVKLTADDVIRELEGLPPAYEHCARLAVATLRVAIRNYRKHQKKPWEYLYNMGH